MATWKKLLVSGSTISQLDNDAGYLASAGGGIVSSSAQIDHDQTTNYSADEHFTQANITTVGTVTTGSVTAILPAGTVSGSVQVDYLELSNIPSGIVSASSLSSPSQGTVTLTTNGVAATAVDLGLQVGDSPQFTNLTLTGNLTVQGDTINANVTNLDIEDRFILLNSGSATIGDSGIVFGGSNGVAQSGAALVWDASYNTNDGRLAIVNTLASDATGDTTPNYSIAGVYEGTEANAATAQADHPGNIRIESGDIFIYV